MYLVVVYSIYIYIYIYIHDCLILIKYTLVYTYSIMKYCTLLFYISYTHTQKKKNYTWPPQI